jgi:hypothetical protein
MTFQDELARRCEKIGIWMIGRDRKQDRAQPHLKRVAARIEHQPSKAQLSRPNLENLGSGPDLNPDAVGALNPFDLPEAHVDQRTPQGASRAEVLRELPAISGAIAGGRRNVTLPVQHRLHVPVDNRDGVSPTG